jgi:hypothetical protein
MPVREDYDTCFTSSFDAVHVSSHSFHRAQRIKLTSEVRGVKQVYHVYCLQTLSWLYNVHRLMRSETKFLD